MSGSFSADTRFFGLPGVFVLESGQSLKGVRVAYRTWGRRRSSATLVCHALTGNADADDWWAGLFGPGRILDPHRDFIISSNVLGSCYGTTGPASIRPGTIRSYGGGFPDVSIRDMVRLQASLPDWLPARRILGGFYVLKQLGGGNVGTVFVVKRAEDRKAQADKILSENVLK